VSAPTDDRPTGSEPDPLRRLLRLDLDLPDRGTGARSGRAGTTDPVARAPGHAPPARRRGPSRRWLSGFVTVLVLASAAGAALTWYGVRTVRDSTAGRIVASTDDPTDPGFEGFLEPTPTLLIVHEVEGSLTSLALLGLAAGDAGGSVLLIPPSTMVESSDFQGPLTVAYAFGGGVDAIFGQIEGMLGIGIAEHIVVDDARWAELTAGVSPLRIDNPDAVGDFEAGPLELASADVGAWLEAIDDDENDLSRMFRHQLFWEAWLAEVAAADDPSVVPGELDSGMGRFVRGVAAGPQQIATLPLGEELDSGGNPAFRVDHEHLVELVSDLVPFPRGAFPGARTRVRLLDGTGTPDHALAAAPRIVPAGAEIVIVGNAESFDQVDTEVRYHEPSQLEAAQRLRDALGVGRVVEDARTTDSFDVTIVLGSDI